MFKKYFIQNKLIFFLLIFVLGIFLRVRGISTNYYFTGELGKELLFMRQFVISHTLPLVGMATSHPWLYYGPIYYWIMIPIFILFSGNPFILFWTALFAFAIGLILNYLVFRKIADEKIALVSTLIQSISPLLIYQTQISKLHTFFFILSPLLAYFWYQMWNEKGKKWVLLAGLAYGIMFSFHFSQIPFILIFVLIFWIKRKNYKFTDWLMAALGMVIPNITFIWNDWKLFEWLPYRVASISDKNPGGTLSLINQFFGNMLFWDQKLWVIGSILFTLVFSHYIYTNRKNLTRDFLPFYVTSSILLMLISNTLHGAPPIHYFLTIFTIVPILYSIHLCKNKWILFVIIFVFLINLAGYFSFQRGDDYVPFDKQLVVANFIVSDAKGKDLSIKRIGPYDYFPEQYAQNYKYLILWKDGNLVNNSKNVYTVIEDSRKGDISVQK